MNAVVSRLLSLTPKNFIVSPSVSVLADLNMVADSFHRIGPIPSALLLNKIAEDSIVLGGQPLHPVHQKAFNALIESVASTVSHLPSNLAIQTFNRLASIRNPCARTVASSVQDKWFENWNTASIAKGKGRPRKKQTFTSLHEPGTVGQIRCNNPALPRGLDDQVIAEAIQRFGELKEAGSDVSDLGHVIICLIREYESRHISNDTEIPENISRFISHLRN